jgi:hypothetical protein
MSTDPKVIFHGTVQLLGWSDTHTGGPKIVLQLESSEELEAFNLLTIKHGKTAGQLLAAAIALEGVEPVDPVDTHPGGLTDPFFDSDRKGGPLSKLAGMWCGSLDFQHWVRSQHLTLWTEAEREIEGSSQRELTKLTLYKMCNITSLVDLDHEPEAGAYFQREVRERFMSRPIHSKPE